jgi:hypothetical protein
MRLHLRLEEFQISLKDLFFTGETVDSFLLDDLFADLYSGFGVKKVADGATEDEPKDNGSENS